MQTRLGGRPCAATPTVDATGRPPVGRDLPPSTAGDGEAPETASVVSPTEQAED